MWSVVIGWSLHVECSHWLELTGRVLSLELTNRAESLISLTEQSYCLMEFTDTVESLVRWTLHI